MTTKIYDYANNAKEITIPDDKTILTIFVQVFSGDETGMFLFTDGTTMRFDASDSRIMSYDDGDYEVRGENIEKWLNYTYKGLHMTYAYERQDVFTKIAMLEEAKKNFRGFALKDDDEAQVRFVYEDIDALVEGFFKKNGNA